MTPNDESSTKDKQIIDSVEEFLAHAYALEIEAVDCYEEIADSMEVHNNLEVAGLFRKLSGYGQKHAAEMVERAKGKDLPRIAPWDLKWPGMTAPETAAQEEAHYLMNPYQALELVHKSETNAQNFYAGVAKTSPNPEVQEMAAEFAAEEAEHVAILEDWMKKYPKPDDDWDYDPDPPVMPE